MRINFDNNVLTAYCKREEFRSNINEKIGEYGINIDRLLIGLSPISTMEYLGIKAKTIIRESRVHIDELVTQTLLDCLIDDISIILRDHSLLAPCSFEEHLSKKDEINNVIINLHHQLRYRISNGEKLARDLASCLAIQIGCGFYSSSETSSKKKKERHDILINKFREDLSKGEIHSYARLPLKLLQEMKNFESIKINVENKSNLEKFLSKISKNKANYKTTRDFLDAELVHLAAVGFPKPMKGEYETCLVLTCDKKEQVEERLKVYQGLIEFVQQEAPDSSPKIFLSPGKILFFEQKTGMYLDELVCAPLGVLSENGKYSSVQQRYGESNDLNI